MFLFTNQFSIFSFGDISVDASSPFADAFTTPAMAFVIVLVLLPLLAIFMFKNRKKQLMAVRVCLALIIAFLVLVFFYYIPTIEKEIVLQISVRRAARGQERQKMVLM